MIRRNLRALHIVTVFIIVLGCISSAVGLLYRTEGKAFDFVNQYGDKVIICGEGLYARDSYFMAAIARGTDFTILCLVVPLLILAMIFDIKRETIKSRLFLTAVISVFTYYSTSITFGVTYNELQLVYISLFSASFFGLIISIGSINKELLEKSIQSKLPYKGLYTFLILTGVALIVAWLPEIISALIEGRSLKLIENYTTQITYAIDMGIIAPAAFICFTLIKKRKGMGYIMLHILLTLCCVIGVMLPIQTVFQLTAGITLTMGEIITKMAIFVLLAIFAAYFNIRFVRAIKA